jgi:hypothetical protein
MTEGWSENLLHLGGKRGLSQIFLSRGKKRDFRRKLLKREEK